MGDCSRDGISVVFSKEEIAVAISLFDIAVKAHIWSAGLSGAQLMDNALHLAQRFEGAIKEAEKPKTFVKAADRD
ncbi:hypothetical protein IYW40_09075 [Methylocystis sp. H4A]|uniref:hypothetical protein n=1 Tax=Methylocystis sp. H4A TaxID=2785788 RepID=UPI0018C2BD25|nr:hypothetical protein [Methylocystis sp. H4A]MBG0801635.1 hypothetical protein [Methylocystis sp. H4A]